MPPQQPSPANSSARHQHVLPRHRQGKRGCRAAEPRWAVSRSPPAAGLGGIRLGWAGPGRAGLGWAPLSLQSRPGSAGLGWVRLGSVCSPGSAGLGRARPRSFCSPSPARWAPELSRGLSGLPRLWEGIDISRPAGQGQGGVRWARPCPGGPGLSAPPRGQPALRVGSSELLRAQTRRLPGSPVAGVSLASVPVAAPQGSAEVVASPAQEAREAPGPSAETAAGQRS